MGRIEVCAACKYGEFIQVDKRGDIIAHKLGVCRRYPPQSATHFGYSDSDFNFPKVATKDWCGEWKGKAG